ncbi:MAG: glycosyltransferase family 2 protein [Candidatus Brocadiaceae bacterium]|jgi:glycosyltransferase involved in cell wall biosynthesis
MGDGEQPLKLAVLIPALNEAATIGDVIDRIPGEFGFPADVTVIVVNDGSTDTTEEVARTKGATVVNHRRRMGLGKAFTDGLERALREGADIIVNIDGDGQFRPEDIPTLIAPILEDRADFVTASRFASKELEPDMPWLKRWGNRQMCRLVNFATGTTNLTDVSCGFRAFNAKAALNLHLSDQFTHTQETIIDLANKDVRIVEVPLRVDGVRRVGASRVASNIPAYALRTGGRILRTMCRTRPLFFFGSIAGVLLALGTLQGVTVFVHWCFTGRTSPIRGLLFGASLFVTLGFLTVLLALGADMLNRVIEISERLLYYAKLDHHQKAQEENNSHS